MISSIRSQLLWRSACAITKSHLFCQIWIPVTSNSYDRQRKVTELISFTPFTQFRQRQQLFLVGWKMTSLAALDQNGSMQYQPTQLLMNWGVYLTLADGQGGVQGGQSLYSDPWSSPVNTVNTVNTVTSLLKNGQNIFGQDTWPMNGLNAVSYENLILNLLLINCFVLKSSTVAQNRFKTQFLKR